MLHKEKVLDRGEKCSGEKKKSRQGRKKRRTEKKTVNIDDTCSAEKKIAQQKGKNTSAEQQCAYQRSIVLSVPPCKRRRKIGYIQLQYGL